MYFETTKILKNHPELKVNISELEKEYEDIMFGMLNSYTYSSQKSENKNNFQWKFNKTTSRKKLIHGGYECFIGEYEISFLSNLNITINAINEDIVDTNETEILQYELIIYSIVNTCPEINKKDIQIIVKIKLLRTLALCLCILFIAFSIYLLFINTLSNYFFFSIDKLSNNMNQIKSDKKNGKLIILKNNNNFNGNEEMLVLNNLYELLNKSLIITEIFENETFLQKYKLESIDNIKNKKKEICNSYLGIFHYSNNMLQLAENELKSTINYIKENEKKSKLEGIDDKIKDSIKRSSMVPYLNEYSNFENVDEDMLDIIYINIYKQKFLYFYAMTKYKLANEIINDKNNPNKNKSKRKIELREKYLNEAIKYFKECKNINNLLGINQIKIIYSLIMISKCYLHLKNYKNAIININEALNLYFELSKTFNQHHSKFYNPKVMLFVETNIFQYILFTISNICTTFRKPCACNWIIFNIFNTSPFTLSNIHYLAGINLLNFFENQKMNMKRYDKNFLQNKKMLKEYEKIKKNFIKYISRLYNKTINNNNINNITQKYSEGNNTKSINIQTIKENNTSYK